MIMSADGPGFFIWRATFFSGDVRNIYIGSPSSAACHNYFSFFNRFAIYFCLLDFITIAAYLYITRVLLKISQVARNLISQCHVQFLIYLLVCPSQSVSTGVPQFLLLSQSHEDQDRHLQNMMVKIKERSMLTTRWTCLLELLCMPTKFSTESWLIT